MTRSEEQENRLINFAVRIVILCDSFTDSRSANYFSGQIVRSGTSPALNYAEARSAESKKDFIHKSGIVLKELRETFVALRIIEKSPIKKDVTLLNELLTENNELISIFVKIVETSQKNQVISTNS